MICNTIPHHILWIRCTDNILNSNAFDPFHCQLGEMYITCLSLISYGHTIELITSRWWTSREAVHQGMDRVDSLGVSSAQVSPKDPTKSHPPSKTNQQQQLGDWPITQDVCQRRCTWGVCYQTDMNPSPQVVIKRQQELIQIWRDQCSVCVTATWWDGGLADLPRTSQEVIFLSRLAL